MPRTHLLLTPVISNDDPLEIARIVPENNSVWVTVDIVIRLLLRVVTKRAFQLNVNLRTLLHQ